MATMSAPEDHFVYAAANVFSVISPYVPHTHASSVFSEVSSALRRAQEASAEVIAKLQASEKAQENERHLRKTEASRHLSKLRELQALLTRRVERETEWVAKRRSLKRRLGEEKLKSARVEERLADSEGRTDRLREDFRQEKKALEDWWSSALDEAVAAAKETGRVQANAKVEALMVKRLRGLSAEVSRLKRGLKGLQEENTTLYRKLRSRPPLASVPHSCKRCRGKAPDATDTNHAEEETARPRPVSEGNLRAKPSSVKNAATVVAHTRFDANSEQSSGESSSHLRRPTPATSVGDERNRTSENREGSVRESMTTEESTSVDSIVSRGDASSTRSTDKVPPARTVQGTASKETFAAVSAPFFRYTSNRRSRGNGRTTSDGLSTGNEPPLPGSRYPPPPPAAPRWEQLTDGHERGHDLIRRDIQRDSGAMSGAAIAASYRGPCGIGRDDVEGAGGRGRDGISDNRRFSTGHPAFVPSSPLSRNGDDFSSTSAAPAVTKRRDSYDAGKTHSLRETTTGDLAASGKLEGEVSRDRLCHVKDMASGSPSARRSLRYRARGIDSPWGRRGLRAFLDPDRENTDADESGEGDESRAAIVSSRWRYGVAVDGDGDTHRVFDGNMHPTTTPSVAPLSKMASTAGVLTMITDRLSVVRDGDTSSAVKNCGAGGGSLSSENSRWRHSIGGGSTALSLEALLSSAEFYPSEGRRLSDGGVGLSRAFPARRKIGMRDHNDLPPTFVEEEYTDTEDAARVGVTKKPLSTGAPPQQQQNKHLEVATLVTENVVRAALHNIDDDNDSESGRARRDHRRSTSVEWSALGEQRTPERWADAPSASRSSSMGVIEVDPKYSNVDRPRIQNRARSTSRDAFGLSGSVNTSAAARTGDGAVGEKSLDNLLREMAVSPTVSGGDLAGGGVPSTRPRVLRL